MDTSKIDFHGWLVVAECWLGDDAKQEELASTFFKGAQQTTQPFQRLGLLAAILRPSERFQKHRFLLQWQTVLEIQQGGGFVGAHLDGVLDHLVGQISGQVIPLCVGCCDDFTHQFADELMPARVGQQLVGGEAGRKRILDFKF